MHHKNPQKMFSKIQNLKHALLHKPAFIPNYFSNNDRNTFWWPLPDNLIEGIFVYAEVFKNFISRKRR